MTTRNELAAIEDAQKLAISNRLYDVAKDSATIYLPALAIAYGALAQFWPLPFVTEVVGTIGVLVVFIGSVLKKSSKEYQKVTEAKQAYVIHEKNAEIAEVKQAVADEKASLVVGEIYVTDTGDGEDTGMVNVAFNEELKSFAGRDTIALEVKRIQLPPQ